MLGHLAETWQFDIAGDRIGRPLRSAGSVRAYIAYLRYLNQPALLAQSNDPALYPDLSKYPDGPVRSTTPSRPCG